MPLYFNSLQTPGARIWVWHLSETENTLKKFISEEDFIPISNHYPHPQRRLQKIAISILLHHLGDGQIVNLLYNDEGKPFPQEIPGHISISHSKNYVGLLYHPLISCGLDLEEVDERVLRIGPRFINDQEYNWIDKDNLMRDSGLIWSVKECLFKNIGGGGILFKEHLKVEPPLLVSIHNGAGKASYDGPMGKKMFKYQYEYLDGVLMVHTIAIE
ncbi:MAG: 4'-phosphopantetheinyl transferase superfamily protein [Bacteroidetes bacterium]|nr:4'-phosphopantetheinyl transferase superfamily protein [Bacteroidota bacterium]